MSNSLFIFLGRSGAGKTATINELISMSVGKNLVSYTSRNIREGEKNGVDYKFVSNDEFERSDIIASFTVNNNWKYGVSLNALKGIKDTNLFFSVISLSYALDVALAAEKHGFNVKFVYFNLSKKVRMERLRLRNESEESIKKRFDIEDKEGEILVKDFEKWESIIITDPSKNVNQMAIFLKNKINGEH